MTWLRRLLFRDRLERDLDAELSFHVEEMAKDLAATGVPVEEARRRALLRFGGIEAIKEAARDVRGTRWVDETVRNVRYAFRSMGRAKGFTAAALISLALGIGANAAVFSVIEALLLRPLPVAHPGELAFVNRTGFADRNLRFSYQGLERFRRDIRGASFAAMSSTTRMQMSVNHGVEFVLGQLVTGNWFDVLGVGASWGRVLTPADDAALGAGAVAVVSDAFWTRQFGRDPSLVGRTVRLNGVPITVVGIARPRFAGVTVGESIDVWLPVTMQHELHYQGNASNNNSDAAKPWVPQDGIEWLTIVARVPEGNLARVRASVDASHRRHLQDIVQTIQSPERRTYRLREHATLIPAAYGLSPVREALSGGLLVLMATVALLLLVACANLASLMLARGTARSCELAVRLALGAGRARIVAQLLTESITIALVAGAAGVVLARWSGLLLVRLASSGPRPIPLDLLLDWGFVAFALGVSLATGLLFGLAPALRLSRRELVADLKTTRRVVGATRRGVTPFSAVLVVSQVALSLTLLIGATLFVRTFRNLMSVNAGFEREQVVSARFDPWLAGYTVPRLRGLYSRLIERTRLVPGARDAALALSGPVTGSSRTSSITIQGRPIPVDDEEARLEYVSARFFSTLGIGLVRGRVFTDSDDERGGKVAVVNEAMVRHFLGHDDPIGRRIGADDREGVQIVGVVRDVHVDGPREDVPPMIYLPLEQNADEFVRNLYVRVAGRPEQARADLRAAVAAVDANLAVREVATLGELNERTVSRERFLSDLTGLFGLLAVAVACLGLYGTISYSVARRTNEIGVRLALGASAPAVRWMVLRETFGLLGVGVAVGLAFAVVSLRAVGSLLYGLSPRDPATLAGATLLVVAVGLFAGAIPAWRASRIDPMTALRIE